MTENFPIPSNNYLAFDGLSIKDKIRERLNQTGIFTDQNFEGSNFAALNDVIAMVFSLLIYNLNKTSINGTFTDTTIYENINRIVKELNYNPVGYQTASLNYILSVANIDAGFYVIPRYSYISVGGIKYSTNDDIVFTKLTDGTLEEVIPQSNSKLLHQGDFREFPTISANGMPNETIHLTVDDSNIIDHSNIYVYIREPGKTWRKWNRISSLYLQRALDECYEVRFNEHKRYEIKFGNDINGKQLIPSSEIAIYYLVSSGRSGEVGVNVLPKKTIMMLNTNRINQILTDEEISGSILSEDELSELVFDNNSPSTYFTEPESVDQIRMNAPNAFKSQFNLTTASSYTTYLKTNFSNILHDVIVMNNDEFLDTYMQYFYNLGLTSPHLEKRALFNQVSYADACNFNNIYCFCVPKTRNNIQSYINPEQKSLIINTIKEEKTLTSEIIISDPVYMAVDFANSVSQQITLNDIQNTNILIYKEPYTRKDDNILKSEVNTLILNYLSRVNNKLGQTINITQLVADIIAIDGVQSIATEIIDMGIINEGLQLIIWNPKYPDFVNQFSSNLRLKPFQFPFLHSTTIIDRLKVI